MSRVFIDRTVTGPSMTRDIWSLTLEGFVDRQTGISDTCLHRQNGYRLKLGRPVTGPSMTRDIWRVLSIDRPVYLSLNPRSAHFPRPPSYKSYKIMTDPEKIARASPKLL